jgi:AhpD family alkylhydroperoxidase
MMRPIDGEQLNGRVLCHLAGRNTKGKAMDEKVKELIAIGASVSAHCQPCPTYHVGKAREVGVSEEQIAEAVQMGQMVAKGAERAMRQFAAEVVESPSSAPAPSSCCPGTGSQGGAKCC